MELADFVWRTVLQSLINGIAKTTQAFSQLGHGMYVAIDLCPCYL